ncbi:hypothetical protein F5Y14DRAFT_425065 [Nemania sp. NC0429]|nr:hypothetical protein F5Y14DRAFT_425065 [Nemania sp. NC0429]
MTTPGAWRPSGLPVEVIDLVSSDDSDDGHEIDKGRNWKAELKAAIDAVETRGDFATTRQYAQYANPGIQINDTLINLPLDPAQVSVIRGASRQAPFGRGEQTLVDTSVRSTWELNASQFRIANPAWGEFITAVLRDVSQGLGMTNVKTELYKLLLYEKGSFFKRHKDSEKAPGMIGTLSICLPSRHEGGEVHLSHAGKDQVIDTSKKNVFDISALAWYADVTHEIKPVENGHRLVLIYNIIQASNNAGPSSAASFEKQDARIDNAMARLLSPRKPKPKRILYFMEHKYSQANLRLDHLKGRDRAVAQSVEKACANNACYLFLCNITRKQSEEELDDEDEDQYGDPKFAMDTIATCDGRVFASGVKLSREDILGRGPYGVEREADSESEGEDDTGNEGASIEYRYHDSAIVMVPKSQLYHFIQGNVKMKILFEIATADFEAQGKSSITRTEMAMFFTKAVQEAPEVSPTVVAAAWNMHDYNLFDTAVRAGIHSGTGNKISYYAPVRDALVQIINACSDGPVDWIKWYLQSTSGTLHWYSHSTCIGGA